MSIDFDIPVKTSIGIDDLLKHTNEMLAEILNCELSFPLSIEFRENGQIHSSSILKELCLEEANNPYVIVSMGEAAQIGLMVYPALWQGQIRPTAAITALGKETIGASLVLAAACAIAISTTQKSFIEDTSGAWGKQIQYSPQGLLEHLRCRGEYSDIEAAISEVVSRMS